MSDLKVVLYKDDRTPRSISVSTKVLYRTLALCSLAGLILFALLGTSIRLFLVGRHRVVETVYEAPASKDIGPSNGAAEQIGALKDEIERLNQRINNEKAAEGAPKTLDASRPVLALFPPGITDRTKEEHPIEIQNVRFSSGTHKTMASLNFELHNTHPESSTEKGYIVVLARGEKSILGYPDVFSSSGPYLMDYQKGETFQVARFRLVNAQFDASEEINQFQILIFNREGGLLINSTYQVRANGNE